MRTGIFGGTFNPPHKGHRTALEAFIKSASLEKVLVIPTYLPPHKSRPDKWADFEERLEMCALAFSDIETECEIVFSDIEKKLFEKTGEKSYTHITLKELLENGEDEVYLFVGTDMFLTLDKWVNSAFILQNAHICVMARGSNEDVEILKFKKELEENFPTRGILLICEDALPASSTEIRGGAFSLVDEKVRSYIINRGLYT